MRRSVSAAVQRRVALAGHGCELEHRVDRHELDAGAFVELPWRDPRVDVLDGAGAALVAIVDGVLDELAGTVEQPEVDAPRVDG